MDARIFFDDKTEEYVWSDSDDVELCFIQSIQDAMKPDGCSWAVFDTCGEAMKSFDDLDTAIGWATRWALRLTEDWCGASGGPPYDAATATGMYDD